MRIVETNREIAINGKNVNYVLRKSQRARSLRISIESDGRCVVTSPFLLDESMAKSFLERKSEWVWGVLKRFESLGFPKHVKRSKAEIAQLKRDALLIAKERLSYFNKQYGFVYHKIQIRNQKTRWGSCSKKGNMNFNYKIALLTPEQRDYVIVHELCHLGEFNHSRKFWSLVSQTIPEYKNLRKELRRVF